jgi:hypothetical protein
VYMYIYIYIYIYTHTHTNTLQCFTTINAVQDQFLFQNKPRKIRLKYKRLGDDYLFTTI